MIQLCLERRRPGEKVVLSANIATVPAAPSHGGCAVTPGRDENREHSPVFHVPVLVSEVASGLEIKGGGVYLDGTLGEGGHSMAILASSSELSEENAAPGRGVSPNTGSGLVIGIDLDGRSVVEAGRRLSFHGDRFLPLQGNYADMVSLAAGHGIERVDGVLLDLGFSSRQVDRPGYGFSFQTDEPLDMRYDTAQPESAEDLVNSASESELEGLFRRYGEEPRARAIAQAIVRERSNRRIATTGQLAALVGRVAARRPGHRINPATRVFQALRIAVNGELDNLRSGLEAAVTLLSPGGVLAVISYHSLEDRIVKNFMGHQSAICVCPRGLPECVCGQVPMLAIVNRRIIRPSGEEVAFNPRSRSARLRLARRIQSGHEL